MALPPDDGHNPDSPAEANWRQVAANLPLADRQRVFVAAASQNQLARLSFLKSTAPGVATPDVLSEALIAAAEAGHRDICIKLLRWGADARRDNSRALHVAVVRNQALIADQLLRAGADMKAAESYLKPRRPLVFLAAEMRHHETLRALIMHGVAPELQDNQGRDLRGRCRDLAMQGGIEMMNRLWKTPPAVPADFAARNDLDALRAVFHTHDGFTGFQLAAYHGQIDTLLRRLTANGRSLTKSDLITATPRYPQTILFILGRQRQLHKVFEPALWQNDFAAMRAMIPYVPAAFRWQVDETRISALERQHRLQGQPARQKLRLPRPPQ